MSENQGNLCKNCKYRFRRVFIPIHPEEYEDANGNTMVTGEDNIIVSNQCLLTEMDIDWEATIECSHFIEVEKKESNSFPFFKHI
jgi:hypothetical protein